MPLTRTRIDRRRLFPFIGDKRVTLIRAAAGSGKTSLIVDWLAQIDDRPPTAWVMLDEQCRSAASFWHRVISTLVGNGLIAEHAAVARVLAGDADPSQAANLLIAELNGQVADLLLVVDDLHLLDAAAQAELVHVLSHAPRLRLIATSRTSTRFDDDAVAAARIGVNVIAGEELRVTPEELETIAALDLTRTDLERLLEITRGHLLALRLALSTVERGRAEGGAPGDLLELVARQMADNILTSFASADDLSGAARLALAPVVDGALAVAILGAGTDAFALFDSYAEIGAGQMLSDEEHEVFVFHPLVRAALIAHAQETLDKDTARRVRLTAADHLEIWGDPVDVLKLIVDARDEDRAWSFFTTLFPVFTLHRIDDVIRMLRAVPDEDLRRHGKLAIILAIELSEREARPSPRVLELTRWGLRHLDRQPASDDALERALRHTARLCAHRAARRYAQAADAGEDLAAEYAALPPALRKRAGAGVNTALMQAMNTSILAGRLDVALDQSTSLAGDVDPGRRRHVSGMLSYLHALRGDMPSSTVHRDEILGDVAGTWSRTVRGLGWCFGSAMIELEQGRFTEARAALEPLQYRAERFEEWPVLLWLDARLHLLEGQAVTGYDALSHALRAHRGRVADPHHLDALYAIHADLARAVDDTAQAVRILEAAPAGPACDLSRARLLLAQDRAQDALDLARPVNRSSRWPRRSAEAGLVAASAAGRLGLTEQSAVSFRRAGMILRRYELTSPLVFLTRAEAESEASALGVARPAFLADPYRRRAGELSPRELVVLRYLCADTSLQRIADRLHVSSNTVKSQVKSIYRKLGVTKRAAAIAVASEQGLL